MSAQTHPTNPMSGNPHYWDADNSLTSTVLSSDHSGTQTIESLLMDNAQATLALAYEQRTANLIALFADGENGTVPGVDYCAISDQIKERLGLS